MERESVFNLRVGGGIVSIDGLTLRDYFAAQALVGMQGHPANERPMNMARWAYEVADAMLAARSKGEG